jgi:hypothetical protein
MYIHDRLKIPIHAFTFFDRKRKNVKQMDQLEKEEEDYDDSLH